MFNPNNITMLSDLNAEPTGFKSPDDVIVTANGDRTITLTGTVEAYYRGKKVPSLISGYISPIHANTTTSRYFLAYDGTSFIWMDLTAVTLDFRYVLICLAIYSGTEWIYLKETHGLMNWQTHKELHYTLGTYLSSGGTLGGITTGSTTATNRRPTIAQTVLADEDVQTTLPILNTNSYTWFWLTSTNTINFTSANAEIISLSTNQPYYNQFTGGAWTQTLFPTNAYGKIFVMAVPVTSDAVSQKYRYVFIQPQTVNSTLSVIQSITSAQVNLGALGGVLPEFYYVGEIIVRYTAGNWVVTSYAQLTGTKFTQVAVTGVPAYRDGFFDYNDLTTATTPIAYTTGTIALTNDGAGAYSTSVYKPIGITQLWNTTSNQFDFSDLSLGDEVILRTDLLVTTTGANQVFEFHLTFDIGGTPYDLGIYHAHFKTAGTYNVVETESFYIGNAGTRDNPGELRFSSDSNATIKVNGFYISVKRRY